MTEKEPKFEVVNAQITSTMLGVEDHGILTCMITLDYGSSSQGFGGFSFDAPRGRSGRRGLPFAAEFIRKLLDTLEIHEWERLKGKYVRVRREDSLHGRVVAIGHIVKDQWCDVEVIWRRTNKKRGGA